MRLGSLLAAASLGLVAVAFVPTASAAPEVECWAGTNFWNVVDYHCTVNGIGADGSVYTCPTSVCWGYGYCWVNLTTLDGYCYW